MTILVVGAGIVGCAIAYELALRGASVRVLDARGVGQGATRASAGILAPTVEGHVPALLRLGARSLALYDAFVERVVKASGSTIEYERSGTLQVALDPHEGERLCSFAADLRATGIDHRLMDGDEARRFEPALPATARALFIPQHGYVAVGSLTRALAEAAIATGAAVIDTAPVVSVDGGARPSVRTGSEVLQADAVIIAAGSWTDQIIASGEAAAVKPIRGQLVQLRLARRPAGRVIWGQQCYAVPWRDGTVLVGATVEDVGFDERATADGVQQLLAEAVRLVPGLREAEFQEVRVGLRPMTGDELPAVGRSSSMRNVFYATGHYRNGVVLAPLTAAVVADLVLDGREAPELSLIDPARFGL